MDMFLRECCLSSFTRNGIKYVYIDFNAHHNNVGLLLIFKFSVVGCQFIKSTWIDFKCGDGQFMFACLKEKKLDSWILNLL